MNKTKKIWKNGQWIAWHKAQTHVLTHALHYGSAVFEGIRCYQGKKGTAIFKLEEHIDRFFFSAKQLGMKIPYTFYEICDATINTVKKNRCSEGYIRPLAYYGYGSMKLTPSPELPIDVIIACWPWGDYLPVKTVDVVTSPFIRIHPKSTITEAKISGHYVNSILAGLAIQNSPYHEAILLDSDGFVAEGSAENIFIVKDNKLITTPKGTILVGITRNSVIEIAKEQGVEFEERVFKKEEIYTADEAFFCGTAVEITPIRSLDNQVIASGKIGKITEIIKNQYHKMIRGEIASFDKSLTWVN